MFHWIFGFLKVTWLLSIKVCKKTTWLCCKSVSVFKLTNFRRTSLPWLVIFKEKRSVWSVGQTKTVAVCRKRNQINRSAILVGPKMGFLATSSIRIQWLKMPLNTSSTLPEVFTVTGCHWSHAFGNQGNCCLRFFATLSELEFSQLQCPSWE